MIQPTPEQIEKLVTQLFDDLVDECSVNHHALLNGTRLAARNLVKDALQVKRDLLEKAKSLRDSRDAKNQQEFVRLNNEARYHSLRILERMRELGL
jgi:hypothetical protein